MYKRTMLSFMFVICALLLLAPPTLAGGWAVITVDELPKEVYANETLRLGFVVWGHGQTPTHQAFEDALKPVLLAWNEETGEEIQAIAQPDEPVGHFTVEVVFPSAGSWQWEIDVYPLAGKMKYEPLTVLEGSLAATEGAEGELSTYLPLRGLLGSTGVLLLLVALGVVQGQRWRVTVALVGMMIVLASVLSSPLATSEGYAVSTASVATVAEVDEAEYGKALFLAKGCATCHYHPSIIREEKYMTAMLKTPPVTMHLHDDAYLRGWLRNPKAIRPSTYMPNLNLSEDEISALIAFLHREAKDGEDLGN